jgi:hypothetical protein
VVDVLDVDFEVVDGLGARAGGDPGYLSKGVGGRAEGFAGPQLARLIGTPE